MADPSGEGTDQRVGPDWSLEDLVSEAGSLEASLQGAPRVSVETVFELLADPGRRYVLTYVLLTDGPVATAELVDFVAVETGLDEGDGRLREEIAAELVDVQLPELAAAGFVDYHRERQLIGSTDRSRVALPYLFLAREQARRAREPAEE
jgi:hypothetical protein